jgi:hypothetical protein
MSRLAICIFIGCITIGLARDSSAVVRIMGRAPAGPGSVSLPYQIPDASGNIWMIYHSGWLQMQGNQPIYSQAAMLMINNAQPGNRTNQARLDEKTGEVILENMQAGPFTITRRILFNKEESYLRYLDIIKNPAPQEQSANLQLQANLNYGVNAAQTISDPKKKDQSMGWTALTQAGRSVVEIYAGKGAKMAPTINYQQGNNVVQAVYPITVPAGKEVALVHMHGLVDSTDAGQRFAQNLRETKILASLPPELRRIVINFPTAQGFIGDRELLRGDILDVVEIRGGDQMKGNLKEPTYKLSTFYGTIELPSERIIGLINVGDFRPRQLLITADGEVFGGKLGKEAIALELASGQVTQVPISQIMRIGYRKRAGEPEEWASDKPFVALRSGDHMGIELPASPLEIVTRYGTLKLQPSVISAIVFQTEEHGVHEIYLSDGSRFAGLASATDFEMKLTGSASPGQVIKLPASAIARLQFAGPPSDPDDSAPTLSLMNEDVLVGSLSGQLKLDTAFDTLAINASEIKRLTHPKDAGMDVQLTLWDSSIVSGQPQEPLLNCQLNSGVTISIPLALVQEYSQPQPQPAAGMLQKIKDAVAQLNADDWKQRDRAEAELTAMGSVVAGVLKQLRPNQPPEAQQRIDQILAAVSGKKQKPEGS